MKNIKIKKGKVAIMSLAISILMFTILFPADIAEYSGKVTKNEPNFLLQDIQSSANPSSFISVWNTTLTSSDSSETNQVKLPLESAGFYDFTVNWGDSNNDTITNWDQAEVTHTYNSTGVYEINIAGTIVGWRFNDRGDKLKLIEISQWGNLNLGNSDSYFQGCVYLNLTTTDILNLTGTTTLASTFSDCTTLGSSGNLGGWDVSSVTDMNSMFIGTDTFNQNIGGWDVSSVTDMMLLFSEATAFNQDIGGWNVSGVIDMGYMFYRATAFNQDIGGWNVSNVTDMSGMFDGATIFNQDIGGWNVSSVTDMWMMFSWADVFNQDISGWKVSNVTDMGYMFYEADVFNQDIGGWNVSSVTDMRLMFSGATVFNQDISGWNVSSVANMENMFRNVRLATENYDSLLIEWANLSLRSGVSFSAGYSLYSPNAANARQFIIDTFGWTINDNGLKDDEEEISLNPPILITSSQTIIKEDITIEWNNVENATSYNIYVNGIFNETSSDTTQVVMLWSSGSYNITVTSFIGIFESNKSEPIIIVVDLSAGNEGDTPIIPGYNFALIPTILLGLVILILKIRNKKNKYSTN